MPSRPLVLLVDDEPDLRTICELAFEADGRCRLLTAASGAQALALVQERPPDAVLLDVMMPGLDGNAVLRSLRATHPQLPVIVLTARTQASEVATYQALGARAIVAKPFDPLALPPRVLRLLETPSR